MQLKWKFNLMSSDFGVMIHANDRQQVLNHYNNCCMRKLYIHAWMTFRNYHIMGEFTSARQTWEYLHKFGFGNNYPVYYDWRKGRTRKYQ